MNVFTIGFTKRTAADFFGAEYLHEPLLAPTQELLDAYKKAKGSWVEYERKFLALMAKRKIEDRIGSQLFEVPTALLCSERTAEHCHRRLVLEYLQEQWGGLTIVHL